VAFERFKQFVDTHQPDLFYAEGEAPEEIAAELGKPKLTEAETLLLGMNNPALSDYDREQMLTQLNTLDISDDVLSRIPSEKQLKKRKRRKKWNQSSIRCMRCYQLEHQGTTKGNVLSVSDENFRLLLKQRLRHSGKHVVIIKMVDLFDFDGSFVESFNAVAGRDHTILLAINKLDLFPSPFSPQLNRLREWIKRRANDHGLKVHSYHPISAKSGAGVRALIKKAVEVSEVMEKQGAREIYVVGNTNVGKSSLINQMMSKKLIRRSGKFRELTEEGTLSMTASKMPGTTLGVVAFPLIPHRDGTLYDTPGIVNYTQVGIRLTKEELDAVIPQHQIIPVTYRVKPGQSMLIGGFFELSLPEDSKDFFFTAFVSNKVSIHVTRTPRVQSLLEDHSGGLISPPFTAERCNEVGLLSVYQAPEAENSAERLAGTTHTVTGKGWKEAAVDVVFPGVGWVAVTGPGQLNLRVLGPAGIRSFLRPPLLPFEAFDSTFKNFGNFAKKRPAKKRLNSLAKGKASIKYKAKAKK
jgi:ribosome biogenesis GTPase A